MSRNIQPTAADYSFPQPASLGIIRRGSQKPMKRLCHVALLMLGAGIAGFAQTASIAGVVTDTSQAVVTGATVTVTNLETALRREARTNETGNYSITLLPVGRYKITAALSGFSAQTLPDVKLDFDQVARLDFTLKPGTITETVEVTASATLLDSE